MVAALFPKPRRKRHRDLSRRGLPPPPGRIAAGLPRLPHREQGNFANPDGPYHQTLPLVTELATALGVERRITDYK
jgi:hypothetical protein